MNQPSPAAAEVLPTRALTAVRAAVPARPLRARDTAVVERTTRIMRSLAVVHDDIAAAQVALTERAWQTRGRVAVLVAGGATAPHLLALPRHRGRRGAIGIAAGLVMLLLSLTTVLALLRNATAVERHQPGAQPMLLSAAVMALHPLSAPPSGPWATTAGASSLLGIGGGAAPGVQAPGSAGLAVTAQAAPTAAPTTAAATQAATQAATAAPTQAPTATPAPTRAPTATPAPASGGGLSPAPVSPWPPANDFSVAPPGRSSFAMNDPNGYYSWAFGQCTWWAQYERQDENLTHMGNAQYWASSAAARGYTVTTTPRAGATAVFQPGVQGAGGAGHVAHVIAVYPDGWFLDSEMNFYWNGGGWGRVDYRYAHAGSGVQFIY